MKNHTLAPSSATEQECLATHNRPSLECNHNAELPQSPSPHPLLRHNSEPAISFGPADYAELSELLVATLGSRNFWSGHIDHFHEGFASTLTATLIIYRNSEGDICNIAPVWWDLTTRLGDDGEGPEVANDFSLRTLLSLILG